MLWIVYLRADDAFRSQVGLVAHSSDNNRLSRENKHT